MSYKPDTKAITPLPVLTPNRRYIVEYTTTMQNGEVVMPYEVAYHIPFNCLSREHARACALNIAINSYEYGSGENVMPLDVMTELLHKKGA